MHYLLLIQCLQKKEEKISYAPSCAFFFFFFATTIAVVVAITSLQLQFQQNNGEHHLQPNWLQLQATLKALKHPHKLLSIFRT